jgi:hypothetical protein
VARARNDYGFAAMRIEGSLLPPEYLQTINALHATHQASTDYGLTRSLNIKDEIGRYWRMATDLWADYRERRKRTDLEPVQVAVDEWLRPLFEHILGYHDITPCMPITIGERHFPIRHTACGKTVPLLLTGHIYDLGKADLSFGDAGRRRPSYGLLQEYLNADDACLWGMVSNGNLVRLARDNPSLTRPAFIEADLERMFEEQLFADFAAFWLLFHVSRVAPHEGSPAKCILEAWRTESLETGERARAKLRLGVTIALRQLGNGFLEQQANDGLRQALSTGEITETGYFQELLRLVYRLLFLFTVEDRHLLFHPEALGEAQRLYTEGYALSRLRDRALRRRHYDQHSDLWDGLRVVFRGLARGVEPFGLPALGGLFADDQCPQLDACAITNDRLLQAIRALAFFASGKTLARVNYRDMGTEELGSVYESLLELHPTIAVAPWTFGFIGDSQEENIRGSERKTTGSYYTPPVLVNELIKSSLIPVIERTLKDNPECPRDALLGLKIIDPACGSGHFLLAAARQVAAEVARLDAGPDTPGEALRQHALRDVVQHCIYGVDRNPLAVELCKTALWIETVEPGKPLSFLDAHICCGDSLVGLLDPKIMEEGIPDEAYKALTGDEKTVANALKRRNQQGGKSVQGNLFDPEGLKPLAVMSFNLDAMPEDTLGEIEAKRQAWKKAQEYQALQQQKLRADLFVGAFFAPKTKANVEKIPLTEDVNRLAHGLSHRSGLVEAIRTLAQRHGFFHWPLAFPEVFVRGGFDVVLGNPPWERIKLQEQEFFSSCSEDIAQAPNKAARDRLIKELAAAPEGSLKRRLFEEFEDTKRGAEAASLFVRGAGRYPFCGRGDVNTYALFAETAYNLISERGRAGIILPTGLVTGDTTKVFFAELMQQQRLAQFIGFDNEEKALFPAIDNNLTFAAVTIAGQKQPVPRFCFNIRRFEQLSDEDRYFQLDLGDLELLNPNTRTCPIFRSSRDAKLVKDVYRRLPILVREVGTPSNPWGIRFLRMFDMASDSSFFFDQEALELKDARRQGNIYLHGNERFLPLYEAKMIWHFQHRWAAYYGSVITDGRPSRKYVGWYGVDYGDPADLAYGRYWVSEQNTVKRLGVQQSFLIAFRDITNRDLERTCVFTILPLVAVGHQAPIVCLNSQNLAETLCFVAERNSFAFDFIARNKLDGSHLTYFILRQLPSLSPQQLLKQSDWVPSQTLLSWISSRVLELTYTAWDMEPFAKDCGYSGPPFHWDEERRFLLRCELDAAYFHLYGITHDDVDYIMHTFHIVKRKDEGQFGEYRTKRVVLEIYNAMQQAITTGEPYHTRLDPPPADTCVTHKTQEISV